MTLTFTLSNGQTFEAKKVSTGDRTKVEYVNSEGKKMIYFITLTNSGKLVMN